MFTADEFEASGAPTIVISHAFWMREFGGDPNVIGKTMQIGLDDSDNRRRAVQHALHVPTGPLDAIMPLRIPDEDRASRGVMWLESLARLKPVCPSTKREARSPRRRTRSRSRIPRRPRSEAPTQSSLRDSVIGSVSRMLMLLSLAVAAVLLTGCINVGNLLLAQASTRTRRVRRSLSARRQRVARSPAGSHRNARPRSVRRRNRHRARGSADARACRSLSGRPASRRRSAHGRQRRARCYRVDGACRIAREHSVASTCRRTAADRRISRRGRRWLIRQDAPPRGTLISAQMAATLTLLFAATLMVKTFISITSVNPGLRSARHAVVPGDAVECETSRSVGVGQYYAELDRVVARRAGVTAVTTMSHVPFQPGSQTDWFMRDDIGDRGKQNPTDGITIAAKDSSARFVCPFSRGGRSRRPTIPQRRAWCMINETLAKQAFPASIRWGRQFTGARSSGASSASSPTRTTRVSSKRRRKCCTRTTPQSARWFNISVLLAACTVKWRALAWRKRRRKPASTSRRLTRSRTSPDARRAVHEVWCCYTSVASTSMPARRVMRSRRSMGWSENPDSPFQADAAVSWIG